MKALIKRPMGRPRGSTNAGMNDRRLRVMLAERASEFTPQYLELLGRVLCGERFDHYDKDGKFVESEFPEIQERMYAGERLMDRAYGRPAQSIEVDTLSQNYSKIVYEVRWLPADPNDTSRHIKPEPD